MGKRGEAVSKVKRRLFRFLMAIRGFLKEIGKKKFLGKNQAASLARLCAIASKPVSISTLLSPLSINRLKFLLCLILAKTGSISAGRFLR